MFLLRFLFILLSMLIILHLFSGSASVKTGGKQLALVPARAQPVAAAPIVGAAAPTVDRTSTAITTTDRYIFCYTQTSTMYMHLITDENENSGHECDLQLN